MTVIKMGTLMLFVAVFAMGVRVQDGGAQEENNYAYLTFSGVFVSQIGIVDPNNLAAAPEYRDLGFPPDWRTPAVSVLSPDGEWVVFITSSRTGDPRDLRFIRLMNFASGEVRDLEPGTPVGEAGSAQGVIWSPNSRYLALSLLRQTSDVFIYSLQDGNTVNLTGDGVFHPYLSWSPDSTRLATFSENCPTAENCTRLLDILNVSNHSREASLDLLKLAPATAGIGCELRWSPDARFLSFVLGCENTVLEIPKEVYVWDRTTNNATNATNLTLETYQRGGALYLQGLYRTIWYDAQDLLIGATYQVDPNSINTTTLGYHLPEGTTTTLFGDMVEQWALNPTTNQVAVRRVVPQNTTSVSGENQPINGSVQILTLNVSSGSLSATALNTANGSLPLGCNLDWSPDGTMLAYAIPISGNCSDTVQRLAFVNGVSGASQEYTPLLPNGAAPYNVLPIGWVAG